MYTLVLARLEVKPVLDDTFSRLPAVFTYTDARGLGVSKRALYQLRDTGKIEPLGRGLYLRADAAPTADIDLLEIAARAREATLCLATALARHDLTDLIPGVIDVALPRGRRAPSTQAPTAWHRFDPETFHLGRDVINLDGGLAIGLYTPERCLIDIFRLRHREGPDLAHQALRRWLRRRDSQPARLLTLAARFPHAEPALRSALEVLLD
jgi:hypothetical protein